MQAHTQPRHRILILGAGYAGLGTAARLARQVDPARVSITLVSRVAHFVERPRLHQVAAGERVRRVALTDILKHTHVDVRVAHIVFIDPTHRCVALESDGARELLSYDTLVYALGSCIDTHVVPGIARNALLLEPFTVAEVKRQLHEASEIAVCGGGLTAIEAATEIAESHPQARVTLHSDKAPGDWLSPRAREHVERAFKRLGIQVRDGLSIEAIEPGKLRMQDASLRPFHACVWAGGFTVPKLAADSGLAVDAHGRALVDAHLRSVGHRNIFVIGDAASPAGPWGDTIAYGCRTGGFQGPYVADLIARDLAGEGSERFDFRYLHQCVSLGRKDAVIQFVDGRTEAPRERILTGGLAVLYKELVLRSAIWVFRHPGPYFPRRRKPIRKLRADDARIA